VSAIDFTYQVLEKDSLKNQKLPFELNKLPQSIKSFFLPVVLGSVEYPGLIREIGHPQDSRGGRCYRKEVSSRLLGKFTDGANQCGLLVFGLPGQSAILPRHLLQSVANA
jgi:hypothetical protein